MSSAWKWIGFKVFIVLKCMHCSIMSFHVHVSRSFRIGCNPMVTECDGEYKHMSHKNCLQWVLPVIDKSNKSGSLEFSASSAIPTDFFPLTVSFVSKNQYADLKVSHRFRDFQPTPKCGCLSWLDRDFFFLLRCLVCTYVLLSRSHFRSNYKNSFTWLSRMPAIW